MRPHRADAHVARQYELLPSSHPARRRARVLPADGFGRPRLQAGRQGMHDEPQLLQQSVHEDAEPAHGSPFRHVLHSDDLCRAREGLRNHRERRLPGVHTGLRYVRRSGDVWRRRHTERVRLHVDDHLRQPGLRRWKLCRLLREHGGLRRMQRPADMQWRWPAS
jgi:hypothetical protein